MTNEVLQKIASDEQNISSSNGLEPKLRFKEFDGKWSRNILGNCCDIIMGQSPDSSSYNNNCIGLPLVQGNADMCERIATPQRYTSQPTKICEAGSIILSVRAPVGTVGKTFQKICLGRGVCGITSKNIEFMYQYLLNNENSWRHIEQGGTFTAINSDDIKSFPIILPSLPEQKKIADFLSLIDQRIEKQRQLVESLKKYKRGYFQRIISSLETSSFELKNIVDEYNAKSKIQNELPILSSTLSGIKLQNDYFNKQAASETTIGYKIVPFGYFTYRSMSDTGEFRFNLQNIIEKGIVSPAYPVFKVKEEYNAEFVEYILNETDKIKSQLLVKKEGGTRYALSFSKFQTLKIDLPTKSVQDKMVSQLRYANKILTNEEGVLSNLQKLKNGLLQQMFI